MQWGLWRFKVRTVFAVMSSPHMVKFCGQCSKVSISTKIFYVFFSPSRTIAKDSWLAARPATRLHMPASIQQRSCRSLSDARVERIDRESTRGSRWVCAPLQWWCWRWNEKYKSKMLRGWYPKGWVGLTLMRTDTGGSLTFLYGSESTWEIYLIISTSYLDFHPSKQSLPFLPKSPKCLKPGQLAKVIAKTGRVVVGRIRYCGPVASIDSDETYVGLQLPNALGDCDGSLDGKKFFDWWVIDEFR